VVSEAAPEGAGAEAAAATEPLPRLLQLFWNTEKAVREQLIKLNSLLLFGTSMNIFAELMGCEPPGKEKTGMKLETLSPPEYSDAVSAAEEEDRQLAMAWRQALQDKESLADLLANNEDFFALEDEVGADGSRNVRYFNLVGKLADALDLLQGNPPFVQALARFGQGKIDRAIRAVADAAAATLADTSEATAAAATPATAGAASVLTLLKECKATLKDGFGSRQEAVESLESLTSKLRVRCKLREDDLDLLLLAPPSLTRRLFDFFISMAISRHLLYEMSDSLKEEMNGSGLPIQSLMAVLALAPLCEPNLPAPLVILRSALLMSADVVCLTNSDKLAMRLTELLFPSDARWGFSRRELTAVIAAVRVAGRSVLAAVAHGRSANDPVAWADLFPSDTKPSRCGLKTRFAKHVALAASEAPISIIESLWTLRGWGVLVLPENERLQLSEDLKVAEGSGSASAGPQLHVRCGWSLWGKERDRVSHLSFSEASPDRAFVSTRAASGLGRERLVSLPALALAVGVPESEGPWPGPEEATGAGKKPVSVFFLDEAMTSLQLPGHRFCHSSPTSHRAGGNGQMMCIRDDAPVIAMEPCGVFAFYGVSEGNKVSDLRVSFCPFASLPCFQITKTWGYLSEEEYNELGEEGGEQGKWKERVDSSTARQKESDPAGSSAGADAAARAEKAKNDLCGKLEVVSVDVHGCPPCGRSAGSLNRRLLSVTLRCLGLNLEASTELFCVADWNKSILDPVDLATTVFQFLLPTFKRRPPANDVMLTFLRGFAGYGGSPGGWRTIDGRLGFRIEKGALSLRLDADLVQHVRDHGRVDHLYGTDHGALRWSIVPRGREVPGEDVPVDGVPKVKGPVWESIHWFVGTESLSSVRLQPLTEKEKVILELCVARSRLDQFRLRRRLDFLASDVLGRSVANWGTVLFERAKDAFDRLRELNGLQASTRDEAEHAFEFPEAKPTASVDDEDGAEESDDDEQVGQGGELETFSSVEGEWARPASRRERDDDELLPDGRMD
jgi:hypothetical protein